VNRDTELGFDKAAAARFPWRTVPMSPSSLSGPDSRQRERPGPFGDLVPAEGQPQAARRRPASHPLSRGAVIGATSSRRRAATPRGLTATAAHNRLTSAGQAQACLADIPALPSAPHHTDAGAHTTRLQTFTKHLRTNGFGPEGQATGPTDRTHSSNRKEAD
jgi:hypothetical protein